MAVEYLGLSSVNGPFVVLEGVQGASFDEVVEITSTGNDGLQEKKLGRVVEINDDKAVIQVFEKTENLSLQNTHTRFTDVPWRSACRNPYWEEPSTASGSPSITWAKSWRKKRRM